MTEIFDKRGDLTLAIGDGILVQKKHFVVSSRCVARHSAVLDVMLFGNSLESRKEDGQPWIVELPADNPAGFKPILDIIHGRVEDVPKQPPVHVLVPLITVMDKYGFSLTLLSRWAEGWATGLKKDWMEDNAVDLLEHVVVYFHLGNSKLFQTASRELVLRCSIDDMNCLVDHNGRDIETDHDLPLPTDLGGK
jgi:hypothetical protein